MSTLWFDVEDIFHFVNQHARPTGIQRLTFEIYRAIHQRFSSEREIRFFRHSPVDETFLVVDWTEIAEIFDSITAESCAPEVTATAADLPILPGRELARRLIQWRVPPACQSGIMFLVLQAHALLAAAIFLAAVAVAPFRVAAARLRARRAHALSVRTPRPPPPDIPQMRAGDIFVVLGSPWFRESYANIIARARCRIGMKVAVFLHDMIPVRHPEWCDDGTVRAFRNWYEPVLPLCDIVFTNSQSTARDLLRFAEKGASPLRGLVRTVPIGTGFGVAGIGAAQTQCQRDSSLPPVGSYVLLVSTIEARKNHVFMFRIWRNLLTERGLAGVPTLVFAGRVGWMVSDFMQQLENSAYLEGKIRLVTDASDTLLRQLYEGCLFTVFPSLYEGWGLPVTESLAFGKPCVVSDRTALPEAGGALARYFDPEDLDAATAVIREILDDPAGLAAWRERVIREFRPVAWQASAEAILEGIDAL